jgi:hypothetical protein
MYDVQRDLTRLYCQSHLPSGFGLKRSPSPSFLFQPGQPGHLFFVMIARFEFVDATDGLAYQDNGNQSSVHGRSLHE